MRVYKIVKQDENGLLTSMIAEGSFLTVYPPEEWVQKKNLFVYLTQQDAGKGLANRDELQLWECETSTEPRRAPQHIPDYEHTYDTGYRGISPERTWELIEEFFEAPVSWSIYDGPLALLWCPKKVYLVDDIKLIREVY